MLKKIVSLLIIALLSMSMLTGCTFLVPLVKMGMGEMKNDNNDEKKQEVEENDNINKDVESDVSDKEIESAQETEPDQKESAVKESALIEELLDKIYQTEYQPSTFKQEDAESETIQWICATYALYNEANGKDVTRISGFEDLSLADQEILDALQEKMKIHIWEAWGIDNRKSFVESLHALLNKDRPEEEAKELVGWDLSRANQMIGDAYYVNFINLEECLNLSLLISQEIQNIYDSWEELSESHLEGLQRLKKDDPKDPESESGKRLAAFKMLQEKASDDRGPYAIPFDLKLVKSWDAKSIEENRQAAEEDALLSTVKEDADGKITIHHYRDDGPKIKLKIPEGFVQNDLSDDTFVMIANTEEDVRVSYSIRTKRSIKDVREAFEENKESELEIRAGSELIDEKYEESEKEVMYYFAVEQKDFYDNGDSEIVYQGYKAKLIDGEWAGIQATIQTRDKTKATSENAEAWLFPDLKWL